MKKKRHSKWPLYSAFIILLLANAGISFALADTARGNELSEYEKSVLFTEEGYYRFPPSPLGESQKSLGLWAIEANKLHTDSIPPLPPGYEGDATPRPGLKSYNVTLDALRLQPNQIQLYSGWNMISIPLWLQPGYDTASVLFAGVNTGGHSIYYWDAQAQTWLPMSYNTIVIPLKGIWIYSVEPKVLTLQYSSNQPIPSEQVYSGWNLIGVWQLYAHPARETLISISNVWYEAIGYDAINQVYETSIVNGGSGVHSDNLPLCPTKGYWVWSNGNGELAPLAGTKDNRDIEFPQVGVEWANDYYWPSAPLTFSDDVAIDFYTILGNAGWKKMFEFGDSNAMPSHFHTDGDWNRIDGVDIALFAGHAQDWGVKLGTDPLRWVYYSLSEWGDNDLEWIFLHGCYSTKTPSKFKGTPNWAMNGVHLVCGFYSEGWDVQDDGYNLANYLVAGQTVKNSWFKAIDITHGSGKILSVIGENSACGNDYIWGKGPVISDPPVDAAVSSWIYFCKD